MCGEEEYEIEGKLFGRSWKGWQGLVRNKSLVVNNWVNNRVLGKK